jgi:hypothetical protein
MRVIPFPGGGGDAGPGEIWLVELEAALDGTGSGPLAESWRELRDDVRALVLPMNPAFERELGERIAERGARSAFGPSHRPKRQDRRMSDPEGSSGGSSEGSSEDSSRDSRRRQHLPRWLHRRFGRLHPTPLGRLRLTSPTLAGVAVAFAVIAATLIVAPWRPAGHTVESSPRSTSLAVRADELGPASGPAESAPATGANGEKASSQGAEASASRAAGSVATTSTPTASGAASAPGRVQQLGASITLTATPEEVQTVADRVSRLTTSEGGFVQSSHVNEGEKTGEATLTLSLPSAKLSAALASLGQLAPVRSESQSLQDITNTYNEARQRLHDATAERQALLRALARASTEGEIDSLRARLAQNGGAIAQARAALGTVAKQASTAEVEVTVVGDKSAGSEGLTLHRGLHDAGRVLTVTLVVLLVAAALLVPLALVAIALATAWQAWRRHRREGVLRGG